jgi:hypothetical protein
MSLVAGVVIAIEIRTGGRSGYVKPLVDVANVPSPLERTTSSGPAPAGVVINMLVLLTTVLEADELPTLTEVVDAKPVPVIVTFVPPVPGPKFGLIVDIVGAVAAKALEIPISASNADTESREPTKKRRKDVLFIKNGFRG